MENKQSPSKKKLISIQEEKLIRQVDYLAASPARQSKKPLPIGLEILQKGPAFGQGSQRVLVSIKPRAPAIKTLYIAEKNRFHSKKGSSKSGSRLAIGDHSSFTTHLSDDESDVVNSIACGIDLLESKIETSNLVSSVLIQIESSAFSSRCSQVERPLKVNVYNDKPRSPEKCYMYTQPNMNLPKLEVKINESTLGPNKVDIATLIVTNTSSEESSFPINNTINKLSKRIDHLEKKILRQEMVFRALDPCITATSDDDTKEKDNEMRAYSGTARPGCSYIQQYSHVPETSAFQRYAHQAAPLSPSKATTIEKEHNSEQYSRDFTTYDGITARGRRQCASVPCKRDDIPKLAAERVHKIRHKLNPVRDYRLMDTVHYLAQGEFAPRDDGIKLTPSREAVLSDIIYEDVCRTHWPNTRLGRRAHAERCSTRGELQRLIDSMLRERVAHVERRRRRHYRIVKLNHRHESCRPLGKTGDIIVASHKNRPGSEDAAGSDVSPGSLVISDRRREEQTSRRSHASHDMMIPDSRHRHRSRLDESSSPGPSYGKRSPSSREPTCCYHHTSAKPDSSTCEPPASCSKNEDAKQQDLTSGSSVSGYKSKNPRLVVKKDGNRRKQSKDEPNLEHYILLPTLVVRTPSNMKRQKKFNELYHKILNVQLQNSGASGLDLTDQKPAKISNKKDIGFNINITLSDSAEKMAKEKHLDRNK